MVKPSTAAVLTSDTPPVNAKAELPRNQAARQQDRPKQILPTSRIAVPKQLDILRKYVQASGSERKAVKLGDLALITGMHPNTVTLANPFFSDIGLIHRADGGYLPSAEAIAYAGAYGWHPEKAGEKLAQAIAGAWFSKALMPKLETGPMEEENAIADLAGAASVGKEYRPQLRMLLDFMEASGLIQRENGSISNRTSVSDNRRAMSDQGDSHGPVRTNKASDPVSFSQQTEGVIRLNVSVKVEMSELARWNPEQIEAFFDGIARVLKAKGSLAE